MPRVPEGRPGRIVLEVDGELVTVGRGGDLSWADVDALATQIRRHEIHNGAKVRRPLPGKHVKAIAAVARVLGGRVADWRAHANRQPGVVA